MGKRAEPADRERYHKVQPIRLYQNGVFTGFRRGKTTQNESQALIHIENCPDKAGARFYLGRRVAYVFRGKNTVNNTNFRVHWALLSTLTATKEPSESTSRETCHQEPWVPKSESCSTQTNNTERMSEQGNLKTHECA